MLNGKNRRSELNTFLLAYRTLPHSTTGVSPAFLLYRHQIKCKLPAMPFDNEVPDDRAIRDRLAEKEQAMIDVASSSRKCVLSDLSPSDTSETFSCRRSFYQALKLCASLTRILLLNLDPPLLSLCSIVHVPSESSIVTLGVSRLVRFGNTGISQYSRLLLSSCFAYWLTKGACTAGGALGWKILTSKSDWLKRTPQNSQALMSRRASWVAFAEQ